MIQNLSVDNRIKNTDLKRGLSTQDVERLRSVSGYNETPDKKLNPALVFLRDLWTQTTWMLWTVIILSFILKNKSDAYIMIGLFVVNGVIRYLERRNSAKAVEALKRQLQINVKVLRDAQWITIPSRELIPGDVIRLRMGDFVPADVRVLDGEPEINQSAITGESQNVPKKTDDLIYSGSIVARSEATAQVVATGAKTYYGKTIELVKTAQPKSHTDEIIFKMLKWLLVVVATLLAVTMVVDYVRGGNLLQILPLILILLLGAIPVAMQIMFSVSMSISSRMLAKEKVLVTRLNAPNDAASMDVLCVDKTGTLTQNKLSVIRVDPADGFTPGDVARFGAMASQPADNDNIDLAFIRYAHETGVSTAGFTQGKFIPFSPQTRRTEAAIDSGGEKFTVYKGAFETIARESGTDSDPAWGKIVENNARQGFRTMAVGVSNDGGTMRLVGLAALHDPPRSDSKKLVEAIKGLGISVKMLTGDALAVAREIGREVGIGDRVVDASATEGLFSRSDGVAEVYPEDKHKIVKSLQSSGHIVGMTGDGVNDAPSLKQAEVGIAVNNATDVAKSTASVVLTTDGLSGILTLIRIGRQTFERINTWTLVKLTGTVSRFRKYCHSVISMTFFVPGLNFLTILSIR